MGSLFSARTHPFNATHLLRAGADLNGIRNQPSGFLPGDCDDIFKSQRNLSKQRAQAQSMTIILTKKIIIIIFFTCVHSQFLLSGIILVKTHLNDIEAAISCRCLVKSMLIHT